MPALVAAPPPRVISPAADVDRLGETEVENLDLVVAGDHHVLGLEIAMHDAARVRGGDALARSAARSATARRGGSAPRVEPGAQRLAVHELRDDERRAAVLGELEDREDVRMRELRDAHRLALEPRERVGIRRELRRRGP